LKNYYLKTAKFTVLKRKEERVTTTNHKSKKKEEGGTAFIHHSNVIYIYNIQVNEGERYEYALIW
jgi:hypothetical protein